MPTKSPRLNVVLDVELYDMVEKLSKQEDKSMSVVAKELIEDALEKHDDLVLSEMAMKREAKSKKIIPHDKAWWATVGSECSTTAKLIIKSKSLFFIK